MTHIELHYLRTARDAELLAHGGMPRFDLEPTRCGNCNKQCGEVQNFNHDTVAWIPFAVVMNGDTIGTLCVRCLRPVDKVLGI